MNRPLTLLRTAHAAKLVTHRAMTAIGLVLTLVWAGGLTSCQRASQAYVSPSARPTYHQPLISPNTPTSDPTLTTSLHNDGVPSVASDRVVATAPVDEWGEQAPGRPVKSTGKRHVPVKPLPPQCDQIVLRTGDLIDAKIKEVGVSEIKYKKCDRRDGPDYTISKRDVLSIKYSNGDVERFNTASTSSSSPSSAGRRTYDSPTNPQDDGPRTDPFAIVAIAAGGLAVLTGYGAFLLGAAAIVFGALSLTRIRKEPQRFKGKGLAIGGMVAGLVSAALILLYILL